MLSEKINQIKSEIFNYYFEDTRPWILGFSGGKDSTTLLQLVFEVLISIPENQREKMVTVVCSDTLVESPVLGSYVDETLLLIEKAAHRYKVPVSVNKVVPDLGDSFFVNVIGRGYPAPNKWFRWCTERLKIDPISRYTEKKIDENGAVTMLIGSRTDESSLRAQSLNNHRLNNQVNSHIHKHVTLPNAYIFSPIEELLNDEVWEYLVNNSPPWAGDHGELIKLYKDASGGECPLVPNASGEQSSCGGSRFGCWVCTVVKDDKSMQGFIDSGVGEMQPLLEFRAFLKKIRDDLEYREDITRNGRNGPGPFKPWARKIILEKLFAASKKTGLILIQNRELELIESIWTIEKVAPPGTVNKIYEKVFGEGLTDNEKQQTAFKEITLLEDICKIQGVEKATINQLLQIEKDLFKFKRRLGLISRIDSVFESILKELDEKGKGEKSVI